MDVTEYEKATINDFRGLYKRGIDDNCPLDHATIATNVLLKRGQFSTRYGSKISKAYGWQIVRIFLSSIDANLVPVTLDTSGNLRFDTTVFLTDSRIIDFVGLNMFDKTFILPIIASGPASGLGMYVIYKNSVGTMLFRKAVGDPPTNKPIIGITESALFGVIAPGVHKFAVSYVTDTGYTTAPGPINSGSFVTPPSLGAGPIFNPSIYTASGGLQVDLYNIPIGPSDTVARQLFVTQADLEVYYYLPEGLIRDNTTTSGTYDFFDTDLVVSADSLFDNRNEIPAALGWGGIDKYHGRMVVLGCDNDLVLVSNSGDAETFSTLTGFIQLPSESDGNTVASTFHINDNLYFTKPIGIFVVPDNGGDTSTWTIIPVDGGTGSIEYGTSSITAGQPHLSTAEVVLLSDLDGLFLFNGVVIRPPLTYKIEDIWKAHVTIDTLKNITVFADPFSEVFYVQLPGYPQLLVANYGDGLDPQNIKWYTFDFGIPLRTVTIGSIPDDEFLYCLRVVFTTTNGIYKSHSGLVGDNIGSLFPISTVWSSGPIPFDVGGVNVYRGLRLRAMSNNPAGTTLTPSIAAEDANPVNLPAWTLANKPGRDYFRECNVTSEKATVQFANSDIYGVTVQRVDLFGKLMWPSRPA